jgi:hypothetical protein
VGAPSAWFTFVSSESARNRLQARSTAASSASASSRAAGIAAPPVSSRVAVVPKTLNVSLVMAGAAAALMTPPR